MPSVRPTFATRQAERVIGDHDRNTLRLRLDPQGEPGGLEPGSTVDRAMITARLSQLDQVRSIFSCQH
jgi:hypothetical protein